MAQRFASSPDNAIRSSSRTYDELSPEAKERVYQFLEHEIRTENLRSMQPSEKPTIVKPKQDTDVA